MNENLERIQKFVDENKSFIEDNPADKIPDEFKDKYREYVDILCQNNIEIGLYEKAYGSYTGNAVFKQNWKLAEEYLLKILELFDDAYAANSLGYIYYYGCTNNDRPDYEKALKYFTIAEMEGINEAKYKLCDMLMNGYGFPKKMPKLAFKNLIYLYYDLIDEFENENYSSEFADVAVRLGNYYFELPKENEAAIISAYNFYMTAKYALELRMKHNKQFGDESVMQMLLPKYDEAKERYHKTYLKKDDGTAFLDIINDFVDDTIIRVKIRKLRNGQRKISLSIDDEELRKGCYKKVLITSPELDFCKLVGRIDLVYNGEPETLSSKRSNFVIDVVEFEEDELNFCVYEKADTEEGVYERVVMRLKKENLGILKIE